MYKKLISSMLFCMQFNNSLYHGSLRAFVGRPLTSVMHDNHRAKAFAFFSTSSRRSGEAASIACREDSKAKSR